MIKRDKKMITGLVVAIFLVALSLLTAAWVTLDYFYQQDLKRVSEVGFSYAKKQCTERDYPQEVCANLKIDVTPPPDWGINGYIVYVYHFDIEKFSSSMYIETEFGQPKVLDFEVTEFSDQEQESDPPPQQESNDSSTPELRGRTL